MPHDLPLALELSRVDFDPLTVSPTMIRLAARSTEERSFAAMLSLATPIFRSHYLAAAAPHAGDWLSAVPNVAFGQALCSEEFRASVFLRLGVEQIAGESSIERVGYAGLRTGQRGWIHRHNVLRDVLHDVAKSADLAPHLETRSLIRSSDDRPGDITIPLWSRNRPAALDVTVTSDLQNTPNPAVDVAARDVRPEILERERVKLLKFEERCAREGILFLPVVAHVLGGWNGDLMEVVHVLATRAHPRMQLDRSAAVARILTRLSVVLQRHNARLILAAPRHH